MVGHIFVFQDFQAAEMQYMLVEFLLFKYKMVEKIEAFLVLIIKKLLFLLKPPLIF